MANCAHCRELEGRLAKSEEKKEKLRSNLQKIRTKVIDTAKLIELYNGVKSERDALEGRVAELIAAQREADLSRKMQEATISKLEDVQESLTEKDREIKDLHTVCTRLRARAEASIPKEDHQQLQREVDRIRKERQLDEQAKDQADRKSRQNVNRAVERAEQAEERARQLTSQLSQGSHAPGSARPSIPLVEGALSSSAARSRALPAGSTAAAAAAPAAFPPGQLAAIASRVSAELGQKLKQCVSDELRQAERNQQDTLTAKRVGRIMTLVEQMQGQPDRDPIATPAQPGMPESMFENMQYLRNQMEIQSAQLQQVLSGPRQASGIEGDMQMVVHPGAAPCKRLRNSADESTVSAKRHAEDTEETGHPEASTRVLDALEDAKEAEDSADLDGGDGSDCVDDDDDDDDDDGDSLVEDLSDSLALELEEELASDDVAASAAMVPTAQEPQQQKQKQKQRQRRRQTQEEQASECVASNIECVRQELFEATLLETRNGKSVRALKMDGMELDLYKLYTTVTQWGGNGS